MKIDHLSQVIFSEDDFCFLYRQNPSIPLFEKCPQHQTLFIDTDFSNKTIKPIQHLRLEVYDSAKFESVTVDQFDEQNRSEWHMPGEYKQLDMAEFVLSQCKTEPELQRAGDELLKFYDAGLFPLLQYCKYLVDTMRSNNIIWGVGRGSSVASFVLYLIGVHRINSLYFDLDFSEFLRPTND